jgi:transcriptional regulator with XRE-family HTH domain
MLNARDENMRVRRACVLCQPSSPSLLRPTAHAPPPLALVLLCLAGRPPRLPPRRFGDGAPCAALRTPASDPLWTQRRRGVTIRRMANERLRAALSEKGLRNLDIAADLDVDPKTVERWVSQGRVPYPRHRQQLAQLLGVSEEELWPELQDRQRREDDSETGGLSGAWWAAWQSSRGGQEVVAVQPVQVAHSGTEAEWWALKRGRPVDEGGYLWRGELRLWDSEVLMGWYVAVDEAVRNKGTVFFRLHPQGRLMVGRWCGLTYDGYLYSGWGVMAREEAECRSMIDDLLTEGDRRWTRSLTSRSRRRMPTGSLTSVAAWSPTG